MTAKDKTAWVEDLLRETPLEVADDGFSEKVLAQIQRYQNFRLKVLAPFFALGIISFLAFFPFRLFEDLARISGMDYTALLPALMVLGMILFFLLGEEQQA